MIIHHVTPHFHPEMGGLEESVARFATWQAQRGHVVLVHTSSVTTSGEQLPMNAHWEGVAIRRYIPVAQRGYYRTWFRPDLKGADVIHLHGYAVRTNDHVVRAFSAVPLVFSLHHGVRMPHPTISTRVLRRVYDAFVGIPTLRRVDRILVANREDGVWLHRHGIASDRVEVLPTPLPDEAYPPADPAWARICVGSPRFVLYLGRLHREKGVGDLLEALRHLPPDVKLVYAGPDEGMRSPLHARAMALGVAERVVFLGRVSEEEKRSLLAASTCLALPSYYEAQGLVVLEAFAQGRPVITTRVGGLPELIEDRATGLLVPYGDVPALASALSTLLRSVDLGDAMGKRGKVLAQDYRLDPLARRLDAIYEELLRARTVREAR